MVALMTLQKEHDETKEPLCSTAEAAEILQLTTMHVGRLVHSGVLHAMRVGKLHVFERAEVQRLADLRAGVIGDVIDRVDIDAASKEPGEDRNATTRAAYLDAIKHVTSRTGGTFHIGQVRPLVDESLSGPAVGALICGLSRRRLIEHTGEYAESGNSRQRNSTRPVPVFRVTGALS